MSLRAKMRVALAALAVVVVGAGLIAAWNSTAGAQQKDLPTVRVRRGTLELKVYTTGELRPAKSSILMAPPVGGQLQIVSLRQTGDHVSAGDVIAEFDKSDQEYNLEQARVDLLLAEQEITKAKADAAVQTAQDKVALLHARFEVRRAELEVGKNELVSQIDAQKNHLALSEAKRRLAQLEQDVKSRTASSQANQAVLEEKRNKARISMLVAQQNIENMTLKTPVGGLVSVKEAQLNFYISGMVIPELRPGDTVWPGRPVAEILQAEEMEVLAKVSENDRGNISPGQPVEVRLNANPSQPLSGRVKTVAGMAARERWWGNSGSERKFDATFTLDAARSDVRPGQTAQVIIVGDQVRDALFLPRQAIFDKDGKPVAYLRSSDAFEPREVKIQKRTESQVAIEGLKEGDEVALVNPEAQRKRPSKSSAGMKAPSPGGQ